MNQLPQTFDFSGLSVAERILLAEALWDSVYDDPSQMPITDEMKKELESRLAAEQAGNVPYSSWEEVKARLLKS